MSFVSDFDAVVDCPGLSPAELGLLIYFFRNQGDSFLFLIDVILQRFGISKPTYRKLKNTLLERGFITSENKYVNGRNKGCKITVLIENIKDAIAKAKGKNIESKNIESKNIESKNIESKNIESKNINLNNIDRNNFTHHKGVNKKGSKSSKGVKAAVAAEGDRLSAPAGAVASEAAPAAAAAADSPSPENSPSQGGKTKAAKASSKASKAAAIPLSQNPPSQTDVEAAVSQTAANSKIPGWTPEAVKFKAFAIWNHYELKQWKRADGTDITDLNSCVFCWMKRDGFKPPVMDSALQQTPAPVPPSGLLPAQKTAGAAEKQKSFKQMQQEWIERPLTDPDTFIVESAAHSIFNATCEDEVQGTLNSTPVHLRERALALAEQMRKEQGGRPRIINTPSTFTYENEDETS